MTTTPKSPLEHVNDTLAQLREIRHHSRHHVECLTAQWLLFDGELRKLDHAQRVEDLMTRQSELHDAVEAEIGALEELALRLQPPPEDADESASSSRH
jgi:hypothetical protein